MSWRERDGRAEFEVKWLGLDGPDDNTWEPYQHMTCYGGRRLFTKYVNSVDDVRLWPLIPRVYRQRQG